MADRTILSIADDDALAAAQDENLHDLFRAMTRLPGSGVLAYERIGFRTVPARINRHLWRAPVLILSRRTRPP